MLLFFQLTTVRVIPVKMQSDAAVHRSDSTASVSPGTGASDVKISMTTVQDVPVRMTQPVSMQ